MFGHSLALAATVAVLTVRTLACIQAHTYWQGNGGLGRDDMTLQVWVNGKLVCWGYDTGSTFFGQGDTRYSLENGDGKANSTKENPGCLPGYSYVTTNFGRAATFYYWENGKVKWQTSFQDDAGIAASKQQYMQEESPLCFPGKEEPTCPLVGRWEVYRQAHLCENVPQRGLCDYASTCVDPPRGELDTPTPFPFLPMKFMVVGDSITHGAHRDWTWRYRIWQWLRKQSYDVTFVGPSSGTHGPVNLASVEPRAPPFPGEAEPTWPEINGIYADGVEGAFTGGSGGHASRWGRQAAQVKPDIESWVAQYQPDYILMLIGFNDLGWFVTGPDGLIYTMNDIVAAARRGKANVRFAIGNVVERLFINGRQDLVDNTRSYNDKLREACKTWAKNWNSYTAYVDVASKYNCHPNDCPDGYDGLHPGGSGEMHIAQAFADVLGGDVFQLKGQNFQVVDVPARPLSVPTGFQMAAVEAGLRMSWNAQEYARGYTMRMRIKGMSGWWSDGPVYPNANLYYYTWCQKGQIWETQVAALGDHDVASGYTGVLEATCNPKTSVGPPNIVTEPTGNDAIYFRWGPVTGYNVNRYWAIIWDLDTPGAFLNGQATTGTSITIKGLLPGHRYGCYVQTFVNLPSGGAAGGLPAAAHEVIVGQGAPGVITGLTATNIDPTTVQLRWKSAYGSAGYEIKYRSKLNSTNSGVLGTTRDISYASGFLYPGTWNYEFCVSAYNGNLGTACSNWVTPPRYPGYKRQAVHIPEGFEGPVNATTKFLQNEQLPALMDQMMMETKIQLDAQQANVTMDDYVANVEQAMRR